MLNIDDMRKQLIRGGVTETLLNEAEKQISSLYEQSKIYDVESQRIAERMKTSLDFINNINSFSEELKSCKISNRNQTFLRSYLYLSMIESFGNTLLDVGLFLLIIKGVDIHLEPDHTYSYTRHAKSLHDIETSTMTLSVKLDILSQNGLPIFRKMIDRNLRNKIAHSEFKVEENGDFILLQPQKKVNIYQKISEYLKYSSAIIYSFMTASKFKKYIK